MKGSRPRLCPRLTTLPTGKGKCPEGYDALASKADPSHTCCKRQVLIPLKRGTLSKHGYAVRATKKQRHAALKRAMGQHGWLRVFRKLNAVMVYSKNKPALYATFKADRDWVKRVGKPAAKSGSVPVQRVKRRVKKEKQ